MQFLYRRLWLKALIEFFHTVFKNPDIYKNQINGHALTGRSAVGYCAGYPMEKLHVFGIIT